MHHLIYVSTASSEMGADELDTLLQKAREKNARLNVTGMLIHREGNFIQILEGEKPVLDALYATIRQDPRHKDVTLLMEEEAGARQFGEWSMNFRRVAAGPLFSEKELAADETGHLRMIDYLVAQLR